MTIPWGDIFVKLRQVQKKKYIFWLGHETVKTQL